MLRCLLSGWEMREWSPLSVQRNGKVLRIELERPRSVKPLIRRTPPSNLTECSVQVLPQEDAHYLVQQDLGILR